MIEELNQQHLIYILSFYDCGIFTGFESINQGFANRNYILFTDKDKYLLRQYKQQGIDEIEWELSVLSALEKENFPTSYPIPRKDLQLKTIYQDEIIVLFKFLPGSEPEVNSHTVKEISRTVARLNRFKDWRKYPKKNAVHIDSAEMLISEFQGATIQYPEIFDFFEKELKLLSPWLKKKLPQGLVHGDAFPDNTLFHKNKLIGLIDFEEGAIDALMYDVGIIINGFCVINNRLDFDLLKIFFLEYESVRPLTPDEKNVALAYIHWGALAMIYWHLRNNLLYRENEVQLTRVRELIDRIRDYVNKEQDMIEFFKNYWKIDLYL